MWQPLRISIIALSIALSSLAAVEGHLDRGLVAIRQDDSSVYVGWRLLASDPTGVGFHVYRQWSQPQRVERLTAEPLYDRTNFVDDSIPSDAQLNSLSYFVQPVVNSQKGSPSRSIAVVDTPAARSCLSIKLKGDYAFQKAALGDLNGDGKLDYIIKQPNFNTDPYLHPDYWKKSKGTYKIEAYLSDGTFLWQYDMGWAIEQGAWYSPYVVYDLDGDGRAEVYTKAGEGDPRDEKGLVTSGPEWLIQIDGLTGKVKRKLPWPDRSGYKDYDQEYNWWSRNLLSIAYLDGKRPHLIVQRGTYTQIKVHAYGPQLDPVWRWKSGDEKKRYKGSGTHTTHIADVDDDGRDEIVLGSSVLDDNGKGLWTNTMHHHQMAHPDVCYVGDIDPGRSGLEIFYGFETPQPSDSICMMDARTGKMLWSYDGRTRHVHSQGMVADITADYPGQECYAGERDGSQYWLYTAAGQRVGREKIGGLSPRPVWWDADPQKELYYAGRISDYKGKSHQPVEGRIVTIADIIGDWREEIVTSLPGELRIYTTTIPAQTKRPCLMQNRRYRIGVATASMGYFYPPQLAGPLYPNPASR